MRSSWPRCSVRSFSVFSRIWLYAAVLCGALFLRYWYINYDNWYISNPGSFFQTTFRPVFVIIRRKSAKGCFSIKKVQLSGRNDGFSVHFIEVYKLHSFSVEVYPFQQRRPFVRVKYSKICSFFIASLRFASFFLQRLLISYLYTTGALPRAPEFIARCFLEF